MKRKVYLSCLRKNFFLLSVLTFALFYFAYVYILIQQQGRRDNNDDSSSDMLTKDVILIKDIKGYEKFKAEQQRRLNRISQLCASYSESKNKTTYQSLSTNYDQHISKRNFIVANEPKVIYCFSHKVASSTWMNLFSNFHPNKAFVEELHKTGLYYKIEKQMNPKSTDLLVKWQNSQEFFWFMVVRHPFERILSAYKDRIMDGCTAVAKEWNLEILAHAEVVIDSQENEKNCVSEFPSFSQFLQFVVDMNPSDYDMHWKPYSLDCAPCILKYNAVLKLENIHNEQDNLLQFSGIDKFIQLGNNSKHETKGGKSLKFVNEYFSQISCQLLDKLQNVYFMDLQLFEYSIDDYYVLCIP